MLILQTSWLISEMGKWKHESNIKGEHNPHILVNKIVNKNIKINQFRGIIWGIKKYNL